MASPDEVAACRLLIHPPAGGAWNMAVDEVLLESAATSGLMSLRLYHWSEPTLSLGYFQRYQDRGLHAASMEYACTRRSSGGGAILHDQELTYSLALPPRHTLTRSAGLLYQAAHDSLVTSLRTLGVNAAVASASDTCGSQAFLCFQRHSAGDILAEGHKVVGSAQRRWRQAVLQHGSILLSSSRAAPELVGIHEVSTSSVTETCLTERWLEQLSRALSVRLYPAELESDELQRALEIQSQKYGHDAWIRMR